MELADWSPYSGKTKCPVCEQAGHLEIRQVLQAKPLGTFSLAGAGIKFPATVRWQYRCQHCGEHGDAEPKESPEKQARILREARENTTE